MSSLIAFSPLNMPQAILRFKKVSDIVIVIAGLEFVSVTQYSLHFGNIVSAVQNHHTVALVGFTYGDVAVFAQCVQRAAFVFRHSTGMPLTLALAVVFIIRLFSTSAFRVPTPTFLKFPTPTPT